MFAKELVRRKLDESVDPVLAISVHPGMVDTDVQFAWAESYGPLGKVVEKLSRLGGKSAEEGAEASLWAAVSTDISDRNWRDFQVSSAVWVVRYTLLMTYRENTTQSPLVNRIRRARRLRIAFLRRTSGLYVPVCLRSCSMRNSISRWVKLHR